MMESVMIMVIAFGFAVGVMASLSLRYVWTHTERAWQIRTFEQG